MFFYHSVFLIWLTQHSVVKYKNVLLSQRIFDMVNTTQCSKIFQPATFITQKVVPKKHFFEKQYFHFGADLNFLEEMFYCYWQYICLEQMIIMIKINMVIVQYPVCAFQKYYQQLLSSALLCTEHIMITLVQLIQLELYEYLKA